MYHRLFSELRVGALFKLLDTETALVCRKTGKTTWRLCKLGDSGKWRVDATAITHSFTIPQFVYAFTLAELKTHKRSPKQVALTKNWQRLGTLARTKQNLLSITSDFRDSLNQMQVKDMTRAVSLLMWLDGQVRRDNINISTSGK